MNITPLHVWSGYSLCRGPTPPKRLVERARSVGHAAIALTDVNGLYGAAVFHHAAVAAGVRPIIGAELRCAGASVVALVIDRMGYENLCRVITRIHCGDPETRGAFVDFLAERSAGLHLATADADLAAALIERGASAERLWLQLDPATQTRTAVQYLGAASERLGVGLLATAAAFMAAPADYDAARVLAAIRTGRTLDALDGAELPHPAAVLRSNAERRRQLADFPQAIANNVRVADECRYRLLPQPPVFPAFECPDGVAAVRHLRRLCLIGARRRYGAVSEPVRSRLHRELGLIDRKGFSEYFLVVRDIVQYARKLRAPIAGRGSGASSLAAYVLGITNVCPLALEIPFERFLNERREDFPDLDLDFGWRIRDDVIQYAFDRWGHDRVAMVCTHNTFQQRSAFRETAKAMGLADAQVSMLIRGRGDSRLTATIAQRSERIGGLPHLLSVHPGGIVIGRKPIDHYAPIQPAAKGVMITQFDKNGVEDVGLVKLDLLGNRAVSTIHHACRLIEANGGAGPSSIDIDTLPTDDDATFDLLCRGDTVGCNQLESPAMRHLLQCIRPRSLPDIMQALALIRPGAAGLGSKDVFIRRRRGLEPTPGEYPPVDEILAPTGGVMVYEDDVMLVAAAMIGCSLAEADRFRKAVQKCRDDDQRERLSREFLDRCEQHGVDRDYAGRMWVQMAKFNAYSFCRAHAASYARLAYAVAYLRRWRPAEFWTAALNNNQSMYHPRVYVQQARRGGVRFTLPDVNASWAEFTLTGGVIRTGLGCVDRLGPVGVETILSRRRPRPFASVGDFLDRTRLGHDETRALILCGAFDRLGRSRPAMIMELKLWRPGRSRAAAAAPMLLTAASTVGEALDDYSDLRKREHERRLLGLSLFAHPMEPWRPALGGRVDVGSADLPGCVGRRVRIAGMVEAVRTTRTASGRPIQFLTLDDEGGLFETTAFTDSCRVAPPPECGRIEAVVTGTVEDHFGAVAVMAEQVEWAEVDELCRT